MQEPSVSCQNDNMDTSENDSPPITHKQAHPAVAGTLFTELSHLGLIAVAGADAGTFLQGQLSNDLNAVTETRSQLSAWCNAKGRVLALLRIYLHSGTYYLQLPRDQMEFTLQRLRMYVLRAQVSLTDASTTQIQLGITGPDAEALLTRTLGVPPPATDNSVTSTPLEQGHVSVLALPGDQPRFAVITPPAAAQTLQRQWAATAIPTDSDLWSLLDIRDGLPAIHSATQDLFIPQMLNLDLIGALNFTKGCYPGQEIVARTHHLGAVKRRMYYACAYTAATPAPGTALYAPHSGQAIGQVISAAARSAEAVELLAVLPTADMASQPVHLQEPEGPLLQFLALPYTLPE
jgi:folate-binding protein YgfZ